MSDQEFIREIVFDQHCEIIGIASKTGFSLFEFARGIILYEAKFQNKSGSDHLALLSDSNIVVASGDGSPNGYSKGTVILWDKNRNEVVRLLEHKSQVVKLYFTAEVLVVVQTTDITFYSTANFSSFYTCPNCGGFARIVDLAESIEFPYISLPSEDGSCINICDFHDPQYPLGNIPVPVSKISFVAFDRQGELIAIVTDNGKNIQLWSLTKKCLIATYKRGMRNTEISCIAFDNMSNYFLMASKRGTIHIFDVPPPSETKVGPQARSKYSIEITKGESAVCTFDVAGYVITAVTLQGVRRRFRLDIENNLITPVDEEPVALELH